MEKTFQIVPYPLRMPPDVRAWVQQQADRKERSVHWVLLKLIEKAKQEEEAKQ